MRMQPEDADLPIRTKIDGAGAEWILDAAFHESWQFRVAGAHFCWRAPIRPFRLEAHLVGAGPFKTLAGCCDAVFYSFAIVENVEQNVLLAVNDDGAGGHGGRILYDLAALEFGLGILAKRLGLDFIHGNCGNQDNAFKRLLGLGLGGGGQQTGEYGGGGDFCDQVGHLGFPSKSVDADGLREWA
jgi:hypothetical protein